MQPWKTKGAKAKKLQGLRKALRDAHAILNIPTPEVLKDGVKLAMNDIKSLLDEYLRLKEQRGVARSSLAHAACNTWHHCHSSYSKH